MMVHFKIFCLVVSPICRFLNPKMLKNCLIDFLSGLLDVARRIDDLDLLTALSQLLEHVHILCAEFGQRFGFFIDLDLGAVARNALHAFLGGEIEENTKIGAADLGAGAVGCHDPIKVGQRSLVGKG